MLAQAAGADELIVASLVMVTVSVLFAARVNGEESVCDVPLVAVPRVAIRRRGLVSAIGVTAPSSVS